MRLSPVLSLTMALCMVSLFLGGLGLFIHRFLVRREVLPEDLKEPPIVAESVAAEWPGSIGLRRPQRWVRFRMDIVPEGPKELPIGAESVASDLPCPLDQLWDHLARVDVTWLLCRACQTMWLLCIAWIALGLWRNVKRPQEQGRGRTAAQSGEEGPTEESDVGTE